ncbi:MAG: thiopurine S-methyltransferase [Bacteroidota bacterium]
MDVSFWHQKWETNNIGFHHWEANPALVKHMGVLGLAPGNRVFVPLCGKTLDIAWLLSQGYAVAGAELSPLAIEQLFEELGVVPEIKKAGKLQHFSAPDIDIFVGDVFDLTKEVLGPVNAIYDRAALVALPEDMRYRYTQHLQTITGNAPQLLLTFVYDQSVMPGPPFSISQGEVQCHYTEAYVVKHLERKTVSGGLKGICPADEDVWLLK